MRTRTVLEGNAFYEIDEECLEQKRRKEQQRDRCAEVQRRERMQKQRNENSGREKGRE